MTAQLTAPTAGTTSSPYRLSFARVVRSEFIKLLTLRSTWWSLGITAVLTIGIALMIAGASRGFEGGYPAVMAIVSPMQFTMLVAGILGAIAITGEYSTGMIRSTFAAEPRRGTVLLAKALVVAVVLAVTTILTSVIAVATTAPIVSDSPIDWADATQSTIPLLMSILAMVTFALIGLGFGFLIRNGAGAIAATVGLLFVLPIVFNMFVMAGDGWQWIVEAGKYLPMSGAQVATAPGGDDILRGALTLVAWPAALLVGAWGVLRTRDA